jgi:hypothetical protein
MAALWFRTIPGRSPDNRAGFMKGEFRSATVGNRCKTGLWQKSGDHAKQKS